MVLISLRIVSCLFNSLLIYVAFSFQYHTISLVAAGVVAKDTHDAEMQTEDARSLALLQRGSSQKGLENTAAAPDTSQLQGDAKRVAELSAALDAEALTIEQLDDQLYQLRQDYDAALIEKEKLEKERAFLANQVNSINALWRFFVWCLYYFHFY